MWLFAALAFASSTSAQPPRTSATSAATPSAYDVLAAEHTRDVDGKTGALGVLDAALASGDTVLQRLAVRALGRWERASLASHVTPMLVSPAASVRRETVNALGQMNAWFDVEGLLGRERDASVRAVIFETIGRGPVARPGSAVAASSAPIVAALTRGLVDTDVGARVGAARGFESLLRRTARTNKPSTETVAALRAAFRDNTGSEARQLLLLALTAAGDRDSVTITIAMRDTSAQVRRTAVAMSRQWADDASYLVRYQALRVAGTCERAIAALHDDNQHVVLTAVDLLGEKKCAPTVIDSLVRGGANWRVQAHALVSLAKVDSARTVAALPRLVSSPVWQARAWAAQAAKAVKHAASLATLARDAAPNVAIAALTTDADAVRALTSAHSGLVLAGATHFKGAPTLTANASSLATSLLRLSTRHVATNRDPRVALLQRLLEGADSLTALRLKPLVSDIDPEVATLAARVVSERAHTPVSAQTVRYTPAPFPSEAALRALRGATAQIRVRSLGVISVALLVDDAPATVATFAALAERGAFTGLTWHRIVPNFVVQGGSPGADEYDALTSTFMRDEVGLSRNARGSFGISTRGRDTGDGQLYINLIDNFRLDHDYTVLAAIQSGLDVMDRIQEGDVIESVRIVRTP